MFNFHMRLVTSVACMASSAPNPYGQPQAHGLLPNSSDVYYTDFSRVSAQANTSAPNQRQPHQPFSSQLQNQEVNENALVQSSTSLISYDGYTGGMSSDSELSTSSTAARHHHRPYSSQSRVYHVHPVPRNPASSSRLSHYSNSTANVQSLTQSGGCSQFSLQHHQPSTKQPPSNIEPANTSMTSPADHNTSVGHQGSISSSGSASSNYLPTTGHCNSPLSPILIQPEVSRLKTSGRQLPQRPFKQSISIDQHSMGAQYQTTQSGQMTGHSPAHKQIMGAHRNFASEHTATNYQQNPLPHSHAEGLHSMGQYVDSQRAMRFDMDMMEKRVANFNLYDASEMNNADLPPACPLRSSSSSGRHLPDIGASHGSIVSISMDQQNRQTSVFFQPKLQAQDHYINQQNQSINQIGSVSTDWLPPVNQSGQLTGISRGGSQFKQTMSIDLYQEPRRKQAHQQHHSEGQHYSPGRQAQYQSNDQYGSLGSYSSTQNQHAMRNYDLTTNQQYSVGHLSNTVSHEMEMKLQHPLQQTIPDKAQHNPDSKTSNLTERGCTVDKASHLTSRPKLQQQQSSSSSNSNLSGSLKFDNVTNTDKQVNSEHQKSISSASSSHYYQHSPQHKLHNHHGRQDGLRRGYTSIVATSGASHTGDFGGSQSALSESDGLSLSHTSHSSAINKKNAIRAASPSVAIDAGSSSGSHYHHHHHHHHSTSSSHGGKDNGGIRSESSTGLPNESATGSTLTKKSNSATQLSLTGTKKRLGFRKKQVTSFSVHRSEEVAPLEARHLVKQGSSFSEGDSSMSGDSSSRSWSNSNFKQQTSEELASMSFIDGLGKGQMISRQGLASPYLGDIQLSLCDRRGNLEIEIIRARNLQAKTNKVLPLTYVKLYLVKNRKCLAKAKTTLSNKRTLNPLFQQQLTFHEDYHGCILQSIVWGNFGKMDKKNFMGIAQISIDDLELSDTAISWYKLFLPSSLQTLPSKSLRHTLLSNSTESFTTNTNS